MMGGIGATTRNTRGAHVRSSGNKPDVLFRHVGCERRGLVGEKIGEREDAG